METEIKQISETLQNVTVVKREAERIEQERTTAAKKRFLEFYKKTMCHVDLAAKGAEVTRKTVYEWRKIDPEFRMAMEQTVDDVPEMMEGKLKELALKGDGSMIRFWLGRRHPDYKQKIEHSGVVLNIYANLTDEQKLERLRRNLAARGGRSGQGKLDLFDGGHIEIPENGATSQESGGEVKGNGEIKEGDIPASKGAPENNGDNDKLRSPEVAPKPESAGVDNERTTG